MARPLVTLLAVVAASLIGLPAEAQWKWRDKGGHVQYSDLPPPPGTSDQDILSRPSATQRRAAPAAVAPVGASAVAGLPAAAASSPLAPRTADAELEAKRKKADADNAAKAKADQERFAAAKADNCSRAKGQLATLESGIRLAQANPKTGEREFLDDKQRAEETRRTRDVISTDCR